jgi:hypothetical protein
VGGQPSALVLGDNIAQTAFKPAKCSTAAKARESKPEPGMSKLKHLPARPFAPAAAK